MSKSGIEFIYENTCREKYWAQYLERKLRKKEKNILEDKREENIINNQVRELARTALKDGLHVESLPEMNGNCLFKSLRKLGVGSSSSTKDFRRQIAKLMILVANVDLAEMFDAPDILGYVPEEAFVLTNEIEYVYCKKRKRVYRYTYTTMCHDLYSNYSWKRIHTELVLRVIAAVFKIKIVIYHNNGHRNIIDPTNHEKEIYLGLVGEFHYVPLIKKKRKKRKITKYTTAAKVFHEWAQEMALKKERYVLNDS